MILNIFFFHFSKFLFSNLIIKFYSNSRTSNEFVNPISKCMKTCLEFQILLDNKKKKYSYVNRKFMNAYSVVKVA